METMFTPLQSLFGGILIGLAAIALMFFHGRIAGITGILSGFLFAPDKGWRGAFLAGMISAAPVIYFATATMPAIQVPHSTLALAFGGLLVGIGVSFGSGCTSGHGVCGLARLSSRSLVATIVFMLSTAATVFVVRHVIGS